MRPVRFGAVWATNWGEWPDQAIPKKRSIGRPVRPVSPGRWQLLFMLVGLLGLGDDFLLDIWRDMVVVAELECIAALATGHAR
jgi:hypothetical protein